MESGSRGSVRPWRPLYDQRSASYRLPVNGSVAMSDFWAPLPSLPMSPRELLLVCMFCEGKRVREVAESLGLTTFTVRSYVKKARQRHAIDGRPATNLLLLRQRLVEDSHLASRLLARTAPSRNLFSTQRLEYGGTTDRLEQDPLGCVRILSTRIV